MNAWRCKTYTHTHTHTHIHTHTYMHLLFSHKRRISCHLKNVEGGSWGNYAKWYNSNIKRQMLYHLIYMLNLSKLKLWKQRIDGAYQRWGVGRVGARWVKTFKTSAKSLQSCQTLCDPLDSNPPGSPVPGILQARTLEWVCISFSNEWKWKEKGKSLSYVWLLVTPWTAAYQAPPSMGFSRQEYWSGVPLPSLKTSSYKIN